jgi:hypothetical protein
VKVKHAKRARIKHASMDHFQLKPRLAANQQKPAAAIKRGKQVMPTRTYRTVLSGRVFPGE